MSVLAKDAYDLALKQLHRQADDLKHFRSQASISAAVNGIVVAAFLRLLTLDGLDSLKCTQHCHFFLPLPIFVAFALFFISMMLAAAVMISWKETVFNLNPELLLHYRKYEKEKETDEAFVDLAKSAMISFEKNERTIEEVQCILGGSIILGIAQIPAWLIAIY